MYMRKVGGSQLGQTGIKILGKNNFILFFFYHCLCYRLLPQIIRLKNRFITRKITKVNKKKISKCALNLSSLESDVLRLAELTRNITVN